MGIRAHQDGGGPPVSVREDARSGVQAEGAAAQGCGGEQGVGGGSCRQTWGGHRPLPWQIPVRMPVLLAEGLLESRGPPAP